MNTQTIKLAHGNGGQEGNSLIHELFFKHFTNEILEKNEDAALIQNGSLVMSTDSFTVSPLFFPGSDIGKLSVCGTCNDLAMMGAKPLYMSCAMIIEEGFELTKLETIVESMQKELAINGAKVVCGDTKVVPKGSVDKLFINTTGVGLVQQSGISANTIKEDDVIIVSRDIGAHGATIFAAREGIDLQSDLKSDCASLYPIVQKLIDADIKIRALRDATRGGVAAVLNEWAMQSNICIEIEEDRVPISDEVNGICEMLGFEAYNLANEGTFVMAVSSDQVEKVLDVLHTEDNSHNAQAIGIVTKNNLQKVILKSSWGTKRFLDLPMGELLPRIC